MNYLMVLPVPFFRVSKDQVALESAFAEHLRVLYKGIYPQFAKIVVAAPYMTDTSYDRIRNYAAIIKESEENIEFIGLYSQDVGSLRFFLVDYLPILRNLYQAVLDAGLIHSGISGTLRPIEFPSLVFASMLHKNSICVMDIDNRRSAWMNYQSGRWSLKSYLLCTLIYDPFRYLQLRLAVQMCSLILLKGKKLCDDFGQGKPHVKNILDAAHSTEYIIKESVLEEKIQTLCDPDKPLQIVYFGRLTSYKGVDRCIKAVSIAIQKSSQPIRFHIIGTGEEEAALKSLTSELNIQDQVIFHGAFPFGPTLFEHLYHYHLLLAAPLSEDTPRSAIDAHASGICTLAYDTYYYRELADQGTTIVVPWPSIESMAEKIVEFNNDREILVPLIRKAVKFAEENTQENWMALRLKWTSEVTKTKDP